MKEIIKQNNLRLLRLLIPSKDLPITGKVTDPRSEVFNNKIEKK